MYSHPQFSQILLIFCLSAPQENPGVPARLEPMQKNENEKLTCWLHLSFPGIYGHVVERLNTPSFLFVLGRIAAVQSSPNWPILTRLCLARDMEFAALIMKNFGAFIPGIRGDTVNVRGLCRPCGHLMCSKACIPVADIHWPQVICFFFELVLFSFSTFTALFTNLSYFFNVLNKI